IANVQTSVVSRQNPVKEIRLYGKIQPDERNIRTQAANVPGRIEKLVVNYTGEAIQEGQVIARIYSPELVTAQNELLEALKTKDTYPYILNAAREKLRLWKLSDSQISEIESSENIRTTFDVLATVTGIVITKRVNVGDYVGLGATLYEIADLSSVWALFDAYESDITWIRLNEKIKFSAQAIPGNSFSSKVSFIDPVINPVSRVARVRVEVDNSNGLLKPEMFLTGYISSRLQTRGNDLVIPRSAVLWTGTRSVVYVKVTDTSQISFLMREIELGPSLAGGYVVLTGLSEGEEIVTNGAFSVDAAAQLAGKPSMMNPMGGKVSTGHDHGSMEKKTGSGEDHSGHLQ
ncbi:MAG TPA: efflux RND transporter periplasmic adaptor subunit, partial [Ignavibacteria bacterium]|nr:efflux RND transporter periplasmic adaptor subunit [Ignavibacteria bacterium]